MGRKRQTKAIFWLPFFFSKTESLVTTRRHLTRTHQNTTEQQNQPKAGFFVPAQG